MFIIIENRGTSIYSSSLFRGYHTRFCERCYHICYGNDVSLFVGVSILVRLFTVLKRSRYLIINDSEVNKYVKVNDFDGL